MGIKHYRVTSTSLFFHLKSILLPFPNLCKARAEKLFERLTIQYGVIVTHDSYVKCYVKTEVIRCNGNALGRGAWSTQNHKSGHQNKWDLHPCGLWEFRVPITQCSSLVIPRVTLRALMHAVPIAAWLEASATSPPVVTASDPDFTPGARSAHFYL